MLKFDGFAGLAAHLARSQAQVPKAIAKGLERAARHVQDDARAQLGSYQPAVGPFGQWPELAESTVAQRVAQGFKPNDPGLRSGAMRDSIGHEVTGTQAVIGSQDPHLVYFEFGTRTQPPRPVLGPAAYKTDVGALVGADVAKAFEVK